MFLRFFVNLGQRAFLVLLTQPTCLFLFPVYEVESFFAVFPAFYLSTERIVTLCKERLNFVRTL